MSKTNYIRPLDFKNGKVDLSHGSGGKAMVQLISELFAHSFSNSILSQGNDGAVINLGQITPQTKIVLATDSHVVSPIFFAGGDIGSLSIHGTVNDVAVMGAKPLYITVGFILEEGFLLSDLKKIVESMAKSAISAGVQIVSGDTKVVERGSADGIFINTTGFGIIENQEINLSGANAQVGDKIILSGTIGDHGMAIMSAREGLEFSAPIISDSQAVNSLTAEILKVEPKIRLLRDPTRGGIATTLNEITTQSQVGAMIFEDKIPINKPVEAACEFLGLDPLYIANEGKIICVCPATSADKVLAAIKNHPQGKEAQIIGEIIADQHHFVQMCTKFGGKRIVDWLSGEQLPRIC